MIHVLQIVDSMQQGGIQAFLMNLYRNINRDEIQFDFLIFRNDRQWYEKEIEELGGVIYKAPGRKSGIVRCRKYLMDFFQKHKEYEIIHYNASSLSFIEPLYYAKKNGVKTRIIHCHSSSFIGNPIHILLHKINKNRISSLANIFLSCSEPATVWMFGGTNIESKVQLIQNGIDSRRFLYSEEMRKKYRKELDVDKNLVIGHVGRFSRVKNHVFIIEVFAELKKQKKNAILMLVGDGELRNEIESLVVSSGLSDAVRFLGNRNDVSNLMQAMDVLIMPSLYEGFPVTAIEAQAAGLPVVMSNKITKEAVINRNVVMKDLKDSKEEWVKTILTNTERVKNTEGIINKGFDIKDTVEKIVTIYNT